MSDRIPFLDLITPHVELQEELVSVFREALESGGFVGGPMVERFEKEFAQYCNVSNCAGAGSGTDALRFALIALGVEKNDIVVTVSNSFIATTEAISQAGALPVFVDIREDTYNMDPEMLREFLEMQCRTDDKTGMPVCMENGKTVSAVIPVHLYGQMADMDPILELAERHNLMVIEDACQAHGAEYYSKKHRRWFRAGAMGHAAAFSFYPGKNLGACGEGGAVTTNDYDVARKVRMIRDHGQARKYYHEMEGYNGRLDAIQAGILRIKLGHLPHWNKNRRERAYVYNELLGGTGGITIPFEQPGAKSVYHLYVIRARRRNELQDYLSDNRIFTGLHYPIPLHLQKSYESMGYKQGDFPVTERVSGELLSLPMYPGLLDSQQRRVAEKIKGFTV